LGRARKLWEIFKEAKAELRCGWCSQFAKLPLHRYGLAVSFWLLAAWPEIPVEELILQFCRYTATDLAVSFWLLAAGLKRLGFHNEIRSLRFFVYSASSPGL
jgi:hypothetical protein